MRVGVIADTHDRIPVVAEFAKRFRAAGANLVLHGGDYCAPWSLRPIVESGLSLAGVFGRNNGDLEGLRMEAARGMGIELFESPHSMEVSGVRILLVHDIGEVAERSIAEHGIVIHGCTHQHRDAQRGGIARDQSGRGVRLALRRALGGDPRFGHAARGIHQSARGGVAAVRPGR